MKVRLEMAEPFRQETLPGRTWTATGVCERRAGRTRARRDRRTRCAAGRPRGSCRACVPPGPSTHRPGGRHRARAGDRRQRASAGETGSGARGRHAGAGIDRPREQCSTGRSCWRRSPGTSRVSADCSSCAISGYDSAADTVSLLAEYDSRGHRLPQLTDFALADYPLTRRVLEKQTPMVVNADDRGADRAEGRAPAPPRRQERAHGCRWCSATRPWACSKPWTGSAPARYSPQELRLVGALAGHARGGAAQTSSCTRGRAKAASRAASSPPGSPPFAERLADLGDLRAQASGRPQWRSWPATSSRRARALSLATARSSAPPWRPRRPEDAGGGAGGGGGSDEAHVLTSVRPAVVGRLEVTSDAREAW